MKVTSIDEIVAGGPGEYELTYTYNGRNYTYNVKVGDIDSNACINVNGYGAGGSSDYIYYDKYFSENPNHNSIDIRISSYRDNWMQPASSLINDLSTAFDIDSSNTMISGFSMTARRTVDFAAVYADQTGARDFTAVVIENCSNTGIDQAHKQTLIDNNVTVLNVYARPGSSLYNNSAVEATYEGVHMVDIRFKVYKNGRDISSNCHVCPHDLFALNGITNLNNGEFDFTQLPTSYHDRNNGDVTIEYVITEHYVDDEGKWTTRPLTLEKLNEVTGSGPYYNGIIQSDNEYLSQGLTNINTKLSQLGNSSFKFSVSSTTAVPALEPGIVSNLCNAVKLLCEKMHQELVLFGEVGDRFKNLDMQLDAATEKLMNDFIAPLTSQEYDIPINNLETYDYDLEQLIKDYNQYVADFRASIPEYNPEILRDKDITEEIYQVTAEDLDLLFEHWAETTGNPNSPLLGMGAAFIVAAEETGIDPLTLVGLCGKETGYGGDGTPGNMIEDNDFFGLEYGNKTDGKYYDTPEEGIILGAKKLKEGYEVDGIKTVGDMGVDPENTENPKKYGDEVATIMDESLDYIIDKAATPMELPEKPEEEPAKPRKPYTPYTPGPTPATPTTPTEPTAPEAPDPGTTETPADPGTTETPTDPTETPTDPLTQPTEEPPVDPITQPTEEPPVDPIDAPVEEPTEPDTPTTPTKPTRPDPIPKPGEPTKPDPLPTPQPEPEVPDDGGNEYIDLDDDIITDDPTVEPNDNIEYDYEQPDDSESEIIIEPEPEPAPIVDIPEEKDDSSALKTVGIMAAVGAGVGAAAYAAHKVIDKNNMSGDNYYEYEKSKKKEEDEKQESLEDQYKEYISDENMNAFGGEQ